LAFPDHVYRLVSLDRPARPVKRSEPLAGINPSFDRSVVLLHDMVQVGTNTTAATTTEFAFLLQFRHDVGISGIAVHVYDPGARVTGRSQGLLEKRLAAAASRRAVNRKSIVAPAESMAR